MKYLVALLTAIAFGSTIPVLAQNPPMQEGKAVYEVNYLTIVDNQSSKLLNLIFFMIRRSLRSTRCSYTRSNGLLLSQMWHDAETDLI